jgi:arylsulfatase A-like enzyme
MRNRRRLLTLLTAVYWIVAVCLAASVACAQDKKPNIVVIFGDDIGMWNVGLYTHGMMGRTPNIDSIGRQGVLFTDHYGQPSCTAGRAAFIMGQMPIRTGMTTIGIPGSTRGIQKSDPTLAEVLKSVGYATGQFGKNHLGDRNEFLPTVHGFDEWFGNLYHLNAEEEPEELDYPGQKNPAYKEKFGRAGRCTPMPPTPTIPPPTRSSAAWADRRLRIPAR